MTSSQTYSPTSSPTSSPRRRSRATSRAAAAALGATALIAAGAVSAGAHLIPGTPADDVHQGTDTDTADNPFLQPAGVSAPLHMNATDVVFGRDGDDLLIGRLGSDTLVGGRGHDVLVGGPDTASEGSSGDRASDRVSARRGNDVVLGEEGRDLAIWSPGDANDAYAGDRGRDTMVLGELRREPDGTLLLRRHSGRQLPRVVLDGSSAYSCSLIPVPASEQLGAQHLVRFDVDGTPVASVRLKDVERLVCPSPHRGRATYADLTDPHPQLRERRIHRFHGTLGAVLTGSSGGR